MTTPPTPVERKRSRWHLTIETDLPDPTKKIMRAVDELLNLGGRHGALVDVDLTDDGDTWIDGAIWDPEDPGQPTGTSCPAEPAAEPATEQASPAMVLLCEYSVHGSPDPAKTVPELVHTPCEAVLCDIEPGDDFQTLIGVVLDHARSCPKAGAADV